MKKSFWIVVLHSFWGDPDGFIRLEHAYNSAGQKFWSCDAYSLGLRIISMRILLVLVLVIMSVIIFFIVVVGLLKILHLRNVDSEAEL
mmetsp:Transcript_31963/g.47706  ORF Transcript_31963/g.47706 Transcript_31963/m.47706 type:complete len:88 (-) Transcript_31963:546-809(-)